MTTSQLISVTDFALATLKVGQFILTFLVVGNVNLSIILLIIAIILILSVPNVQGNILRANVMPKRMIFAAATASAQLNLTAGIRTIALIHLNALCTLKLRGQKTDFPAFAISFSRFFY